MCFTVRNNQALLPTHRFCSLLFFPDSLAFQCCLFYFEALREQRGKRRPGLELVFWTSAAWQHRLHFPRSAPRRHARKMIHPFPPLTPGNASVASARPPFCAPLGSPERPPCPSGRKMERGQPAQRDYRFQSAILRRRAPAKPGRLPGPARHGLCRRAQRARRAGRIAELWV